MAVSQQIRQSASDLSQTIRSSHSNAQFPMWVSGIKYVTLFDITSGRFTCPRNEAEAPKHACRFAGCCLLVGSTQAP